VILPQFAIQNCPQRREAACVRQSCQGMLPDFHQVFFQVNLFNQGFPGKAVSPLSPNYQRFSNKTPRPEEGKFQSKVEVFQVPQTLIEPARFLQSGSPNGNHLTEHHEAGRQDLGDIAPNTFFARGVKRSVFK
jgi:hypothetical protein